MNQMIKRLIYTTSLLTALLHGQAQIKWPAVNSVTKPWTRWWWMGSAVTPKDLSANMKQYAEVGLGGLEITPIYGVGGYESKFVDYLSPRWMELFSHTLQEAKRLNLQIDMATGSGWPFGGGPLIGDADACKNFVYKTWSVKTGETVKEPIAFEQQPSIEAIGNTIASLDNIWPKNPSGEAVVSVLKESQKVTDVSKLAEPVYANKNLQGLAIDQLKYKKNLPVELIMAYGDNGQTIDLTGKVDDKGNLKWKAPAGNWTVYALFMGWHGKMVERAAPGAEGNAIDHFSEAAIKKYLSRFDTAFTGNDLSQLRGFFNDSYEVDDARGQSNYTPGFFTEFKARRGYDLKLYLPQLLAKQRDDISLRVLYDYRQTIADLLLEKFTIPWHKWAQSKGKVVRNQSHGSPANILDCYGVVDIPETEGTELLRFKFAASAAHILGKPLASAEAATWLNEHFKTNLGDVKSVIDKYFIGGVNHIVYHGTSYSPMNDPWPGWLFYAAVHFQPIHPFWKDFGALNNYVTRCQSFLQSGIPDNDVLLYFPFSDHNSEPGRDLLHHYDGMKGFESSDFNKVAEELLQKGYAFDFISDNQLQQVTAKGGGVLETPGGKYRTIVLANTKYLPLPTLQKLVTLAKYGARILVYKNFPGGVPGYGQLETRQKQFTDITAALQFAKEGTLQKAITGSGQFIKGDDIGQLLAAGNVYPEPMYAFGLQCIRRNVDGGNYYFISNSSGKVISQWIPLGRKAASAIAFDPMQQQSGIARTRIVKGVTEVYVVLQPGESFVLQTSNTILKGKPYSYYNIAGKASEIKGNWTLRFVMGGPDLPKTTTTNKLGSWTEIADPLGKIFSGTAQYSIHFAKPAAPAPAYMLDLGKVAWSAEVVLNGKPIATVLGPVYRVTIPASQLKADNLLEVNVSNGITNRIIDLEKGNVPWKKFYNVNFPARLPENRGANGIFTAANWQPETSGLLGPVTITPLK
jgi:hypothetical protein